MSTDDSDADEPTESLTKSKSDLYAEHGLQDTTLGKVVCEQEAEQERESSKRAALVEKKILLAQAEQQGLGNDPAVEALRADVMDLEGELEAEALRAQRADELEEARKKIDNLEGLAARADSQNQDRLAENYRQRAASLKSEFPTLEDDDESGRYDTGPSEAEALKRNEAAEALQEFKDRKSRQEIDERMSDEDRKMLANYKSLRDQASSDKIREKYEQKIEGLRNEYA